MAEMDRMAQLGSWVGYHASGWRHEPRAGQRWLVVERAAQDGSVRRCSGSRQAVDAFHDRTVRRVRDLLVFEDPMGLRVERLRLTRVRYGRRRECLDWLDRHARVT